MIATSTFLFHFIIIISIIIIGGRGKGEAMTGNLAGVSQPILRHPPLAWAMLYAPRTHTICGVNWQMLSSMAACDPIG